MLHVTVKDKKGAYVTGLPRDAFAVFEDGRPQTIRLFIAEDSPVTVGLLIDSSGSMQPNRERVIAAATAFAESSNPDDELFALSTGGEAFEPRDSREIAAVLQQIARVIRHAYTIGYVSDNEAQDGSFRKIRVVVQTADRRALVVRTREGYLAPRRSTGRSS